MAAPQGLVRVHQQDQTVTFRVEGRATMTQSLPLRRFVERCLAGGVTAVRVDLRDCIYMDSTFLGTLLTLHGVMTRRGQGRLTLVAPSLLCDRLLQQMGLGEVFTTDPGGEPDAGPWTDLPLEAEDPNSFRRNVVQAHEELASLPGNAGEQFRQVARCIGQQPEKPAPPPGGPKPE